MKRTGNWCNTNRHAGTLPAQTKRPKLSSKLTLSLLGAFAISAASGVARATPIPTSTDEVGALYGQVTSQPHIDHTAQASVQVTSMDEASAQAGSLVPAPISPSVGPLIARDADEGRAAAFAGDQGSGEEQSLAATPAGSGMAEQGNCGCQR